MPVRVPSSDQLAAAHNEGTAGGMRRREWPRACMRSRKAVAKAVERGVRFVANHR